jgi:hypothetical protein
MLIFKKIQNNNDQKNENFALTITKIKQNKYF